MKKTDVQNALDEAAKLEARARQIRADAHHAACRAAIHDVALAERKLGRTTEMTIAVGSRNEAVDVVKVLGQVRRCLESVLRLTEPYEPGEDQ